MALSLFTLAIKCFTYPSIFLSSFVIFFVVPQSSRNLIVSFCMHDIEIIWKYMKVSVILCICLIMKTFS